MTLFKSSREGCEESSDSSKTNYKVTMLQKGPLVATHIVRMNSEEMPLRDNGRTSCLKSNQRNLAVEIMSRNLASHIKVLMCTIEWMQI